MENKMCSKCKEYKEIENFGWNKSRNTYACWCKSCKREVTKRWLQTERGKELHKINEQVRRSKSKETVLLTNAKMRAKKEKLEFNITREDIIIPKFCPVFGILICTENKKICDNSPSIDRINNDLGYVKGNVAVISFKANRMKSNGTIEEMEKLLAYLYKNNSNYRNSMGVKCGTRPSKYYSFNGKSQSLIDWAEEYGINHATLNNRVNRLKWSFEKALLTPVRKFKNKV